MPSSHSSHWAEPIIARLCGPPKKTSKYIAGYLTPAGLEIALDRLPKLAQVWLTVPPADHLSTADTKHYPPSKSRNSNLKSQANTLWLGNDAWHIKLANSVDLEALLNWYCALTKDSKRPSGRAFDIAAPAVSPAPSLEDIQFAFDKALRDAKRLSVQELRERGAEFPRKPTRISVSSFTYRRNPYVVQQALQRADGICEGCDQPAPFTRRTDGSPYLEVHHKITLASGGDDTLENAISLCPNCHREMHFG